jgi:hypothetical protein
MLELEGTEEYNNVGALLGVDGLDGDELLGALRKMNAIKRQKVINQLANTGAPSKGSRAEMEKHFGELPPHIKEGLARGELRLADTIIYSIKPITSKLIKCWETQDVKTINLNSLSSARLPKNQALLVSGITILVGVSADATLDKVMGTRFAGVESMGVVVNGEFSLKANKKVIMPESSMHLFKTDNFQAVPQGYYKLHNPRIIEDDILIEATIEMGSFDGIVPNSYLFIGLHGTITTP